MTLPFRRFFWYVVLVLAGAVLWILVTTPTGFPLVDLSVFAGPGVVFAIAMNWAWDAPAPKPHDWRGAVDAAMIGAILFPPFVAAILAWGGTLAPGAMEIVLVLAAWIALIVGFIGGVVYRRLWREPPEARRAAQEVPRLFMIR